MQSESHIFRHDAALEHSIANMQAAPEALGAHIEVPFWGKTSPGRDRQDCDMQQHLLTAHARQPPTSTCA